MFQLLNRKYGSETNTTGSGTFVFTEKGIKVDIISSGSVYGDNFGFAIGPELFEKEYKASELTKWKIVYGDFE